MRRRLFTFLSALSLVLCLATVVLWVRSYWMWDTLFDGAGSKVYYWVGSNWGSVSFCWARFSSEDEMRHSVFPHIPYQVLRFWPPFGGESTSDYWDAVDVRPNRHAMGFGYGGSVFGEGALAAPYWLPVAFLCVLPARWAFLRYRRRSRNRRGLCAACGYDLRATPDRCPECGTVPDGLRTK